MAVSIVLVLIGLAWALGFAAGACLAGTALEKRYDMLGIREHLE